MKQITEYTDFINIIRCLLQNQSDLYIESSSELDWDSIFEEFRNHSLTTLAIDSIEKMNIPIRVLQPWKEEIFKQSSHFVKLLHVQEKISDCLNSENINWVILKGSSAALYYQNPYQRTIGDIDILVSENDFERAKKCLSNFGFAFGNNIYKYDRHQTARKDGIEIELHRFFAETRDSGNDNALNNLLFDSLSNYHIKKINNTPFNTLPILEEGLVFIEHIWHHIRTGIGLRQILDFIMYTDKVLNDNFWHNSFMQVSQDFGYETLCKVVARTGQMYFGLDNSIMWCKDIDDNLCTEFLEMILNQGNFGEKTSLQFNPTIRVLNKKNEGIASFLKYEQASGMKNWKAAQKHNILEPLAWIYGIGRHIVKTLSNKTNILRLKSNYIQSIKESILINKLKKK